MTTHSSSRIPETKVVQLTTIKTAKRNARRHNDANNAAIRQSLEQFGQREALVVRKGEVVGGNARLAIMRDLGIKQALVISADDLDEKEALKLAIALNRSGELAEWDAVELMAQMDLIGGELPGFSQRDIEEMRREAAGSVDVVEDEAPPAPKKPITKPGDVWQLGKHRLVCGDSTQKLVTDKAIGADKPILMVTDPPYGISLDMEWRDRAGVNEMGSAEHSHMIKGGKFNVVGDTIADWSRAFENVPSLGIAYVWHASAHADAVMAGLRRLGFTIRQQIIWAKNVFALSRQWYHWQHEPCWLAVRGKNRPWNGVTDQSTIWNAPSPKHIMSGSKEDKFDHPTQKPVMLYARPIENHTKIGDVMFEPFSGSGTAIAAAEQLGRICCAIEIDPRYVDVAVERWQNLTGGKAKRIVGNGRSKRSKPAHKASAQDPGYQDVMQSTARLG